MGIFIAAAFVAGGLGSVLLFGWTFSSRKKVRPGLGLKRWLIAILAGIGCAALALAWSHAGYPTHGGSGYTEAMRFLFILTLSPGIAVAGSLGAAIMLGRREERPPQPPS